MRQIGKLDASLIAGKWQNVRQNVVLTDERIAHIMEGHRADFEAYGSYIANAIEHPRYILDDRKNDHTALYIGTAKDTNITVVIKVAVEDSGANQNSSVITMYRCGEKRLKRLVKNNVILYKRE